MSILHAIISHQALLMVLSTLVLEEIRWWSLMLKQPTTGSTRPKIMVGIVRIMWIPIICSWRGFYFQGMISATASIGMILLWDVEAGLSIIDKYLYSTDDNIKVRWASVIMRENIYLYEIVRLVLCWLLASWIPVCVKKLIPLWHCSLNLLKVIVLVASRLLFSGKCHEWWIELFYLVAHKCAFLVLLWHMQVQHDKRFQSFSCPL